MGTKLIFHLKPKSIWEDQPFSSFRPTYFSHIGVWDKLIQSHALTNFILCESSRHQLSLSLQWIFLTSRFHQMCHALKILHNHMESLWKFMLVTLFSYKSTKIQWDPQTYESFDPIVPLAMIVF